MVGLAARDRPCPVRARATATSSPTGGLSTRRSRTPRPPPVALSYSQARPWSWRSLGQRSSTIQRGVNWRVSTRRRVLYRRASSCLLCALSTGQKGVSAVSRCHTNEAAKFVILGTGLHERRQQAGQAVERVTGIEPAWPAWLAGARRGRCWPWTSPIGRSLRRKSGLSAA